MKSRSTFFKRLTNFAGFVIAFLVLQQYAIGQSNEDMSSQQIFDKIVDYYDPEGLWNTFSGKMKQTSLWNGNLNSQDISLNNKTNTYICFRKREDGIYIKGIKDGQSFFSINGKSYTKDDVPEAYQKYPYSLSEHYAQTYKEHHAFHFSYPLVLKNAGAKPLEGVGEKYVFGQLCQSIKFKALPNYYINGYYTGDITLYVIPEQHYKLHAVHIDNGKGRAKEGWMVLLDGEIEVEGIKIPASKLTFYAGSLDFLIVDILEIETGN
ncbi:DUF6503 family protein [Psychroserpens sp. SPM9]|uniref:DUF6503 family protein n=1 Tax=Psychroserpens sp. SPM9 TaxID=2975598 RepID=UPI0021A61ECA|nr:DUF6503 family protein [Psychroserpens sp. SPM9]MDG5490726.1 DUF6503 family protein [Psychroserpens sp. SPM9]